MLGSSACLLRGEVCGKPQPGSSKAPSQTFCAETPVDLPECLRADEALFAQNKSCCVHAEKQRSFTLSQGHCRHPAVGRCRVSRGNGPEHILAPVS